MDAVGGISRQVDIVVYRRSRYPILAVGGVKHFMVESVAAVLEVKARIGSVDVLTDAMRNVASVKRLDRTGDGRNLVTSEAARRAVNANVVQDQIWGAIVAGASMTYENCWSAFGDWLDANPDRREWPNGYYDVREFRLNYLRTDNDFPRWSTSDPMTADGTQGGKGLRRSWGDSPPLAFLAADLLDFLQVTPYISFATTSGLDRAGTGQSGYFYRTMIPMSMKWMKFDTGNGEAREGSV